jgi:hypothetical protein
MASSVVKSDVAISISTEADVPQDMVHEIENMNEPAFYAEIAKSIEGEVLVFKLGGLLSRALTQKWFKGHAEFKSFVEDSGSNTARP